MIGCPGTTTYLQGQLAERIPAKITQYGWEVVYGSVVWKIDPGKEDTTYGNAWFVAKKDSVDFEDGTSRPAYIVAIAATSGVYDWVYEDLAIGNVVDLDSWARQGDIGLSKMPTPIPNNASAPKDAALVSLGFTRGVYQILNNVPLEGSPGYPHTLPQFIKSLQATPSRPSPKLIIAGHSLGGALSPALAYILLKTDSLGIFSNNTYVYPTAGPTPGNRVFAQNFKALFPPHTNPPASSYKHWNVNIINRLDIVPCAYCTDPKYKPEVLPSIVRMYNGKNDMKYIPIVALAIYPLKSMSNKLYVPIDLKPFESPIPKPSIAPRRFREFLDVAHKQHVRAYSLEILKVDIPEPECPKSEVDDWKAHPVLGHIVQTKIQVEGNIGTLFEEATFELPEWAIAN
ncbi:hypothetical protein OPQ81_000144 [Rhizoctonia solani]|nr:hypothetical protein OPQ81_000144 [Rhizoctonia solani]